MNGQKVDSDNVIELIEQEINNFIVPNLKNHKTFPAIVIGANFSEENNGAITLMANPSLTKQQIILILEELVKFEKQKLKNVN